MTRRHSVRNAGLALPAGLEAPSAVARMPTDGAKTYVLVHGAWHGGWCWRPVAEALRAQGHRVLTPTLTGLGERRHLLTRDITLDVFIADLVNVFEMDELQDVILVGHSFGGLAISGLADRMPDRVRHLVYLDSLILESGQSPFSVLPPDLVAARRRLVAEKGNGVAIPVPPVSDFGIPDDHASAAWVRRHLTPHPVNTYESALTLTYPLGNGRPRTYIHCTAPAYAALQRLRQWVKQQQGWQWREIATCHDAMVTAPSDLAQMLANIG
jgi:pimeloyl-ACP methyl ester carboxylesterase